MNRRLAIAVTALTVFLGALVPTRSLATSNTTAHTYGYVYLGTNSTVGAYNASTYLNSMGWQASYYNGSYVSSIFETAKTDGLVMIDYHGGPGRMVDSLGNYLCAQGCSGSSYNLSAYGTELNDVDFFFFDGCQTAATHSTYGNLVDMAISKGAWSAMGFTSDIDGTSSTCNNQCLVYGNWWDDRFFYNSQFYVVSTAAIQTASDYYAKYGRYGGFNNYSIKGSQVSLKRISQ